MFNGNNYFLAAVLYLYDLGISVPVCIRKQIRYTGFWPGALRTVPPVYWPVAFITVPPVYRLLAMALIYRAAGIPASVVQRVKSITDRMQTQPLRGVNLLQRRKLDVEAVGFLLPIFRQLLIFVDLRLLRCRHSLQAVSFFVEFFRFVLNVA